MPKHKHAEFIKAKADGLQIQETIPDAVNWLDMPENDWDFVDEYIYRIKPERVWPVTSLTKTELQIAGGTSPLYEDRAVKIANAAIKRYIEDNEK